MLKLINKIKNKMICFALGHEWELTIRKDLQGGSFAVCQRCGKIMK